MSSQNIDMNAFQSGMRCLGIINPVAEFWSREEREKHPGQKPPDRTINGQTVYDVSVMLSGREYGREVATPLDIRVPLSPDTRTRLEFGVTLRFEGLSISLRDGEGRQKYVTFIADSVTVVDPDDEEVQL